MENLISALQKRRRLMFYILFVVAIIGIGVDRLFEISPADYYSPVLQLYFVYGLISYKLVELVLLYFFFYHRHMLKCTLAEHDKVLRARFEKNAKRFFMLVPHGSVIFGIIAYKLTAELEYFLQFLGIAIIALSLVRPQAYFESKNT
jgi:hypothetical protein